MNISSSSSSPGSDLLLTSAQSLLTALIDKPSRTNTDTSSRIPALSAGHLLTNDAPVDRVIWSAKALIGGIADGIIIPAEFPQPADCRFDPSLLILAIAFQRLQNQGKKMYYAAHTWAELVPVESLGKLQTLVSQHTGQKMTTDLRQDELIFGFLPKK